MADFQNEDFFQMVEQDAEQKSAQVVLDVPKSHNNEIKEMRDKGVKINFNPAIMAWTASKETMEQTPRLKDFAEPRVKLDTVFMLPEDLQKAKAFGIFAHKDENNKNVFTAPAVIQKDRPDVIEYFSQAKCNERINQKKQEEFKEKVQSKEMIELEVPQYKKPNPNYVKEKNPSDFQLNNDPSKMAYLFDQDKINKVKAMLKENGAEWDRNKGNIMVVSKENFEKNREKLKPFVKDKAQNIALYPMNKEQRAKLYAEGIEKVKGEAHIYKVPSSINRDTLRQFKTEMSQNKLDSNIKQKDAATISNIKAQDGQMIFLTCVNQKGEHYNKALEKIAAENNALIAKQASPIYSADRTQMVKNQETKIGDMLSALENLRKNNPTAPIMFHYDAFMHNTMEQNKGLKTNFEQTCTKLGVKATFASAQKLAGNVPNQSSLKGFFKQAKDMITAKIKTKEISQKVEKELAQKQTQKMEQEQKQEQKLEKTQTKSKSHGR